MTHNKRTQQGGVSVFLIVTVILIAVLIGSMTFARWRADQAQNSPVVAPETSVEQEESATASTDDSSGSTEQQITDTPESGALDQPDPSAVATDGAQPDAPSIEVAATGPTEVFLSTIALGIITMLSIMYFQSRIRVSA